MIDKTKKWTEPEKKRVNITVTRDIYEARCKEDGCGKIIKGLSERQLDYNLNMHSSVHNHHLTGGKARVTITPVSTS